MGSPNDARVINELNICAPLVRPDDSSNHNITLLEVVADCRLRRVGAQWREVPLPASLQHRALSWWCEIPLNPSLQLKCVRTSPALKRDITQVLCKPMLVTVH